MSQQLFAVALTVLWACPHSPVPEAEPLAALGTGQDRLWQFTDWKRKEVLP